MKAAEIRAAILSSTNPDPKQTLDDIATLVKCAECNGEWTDITPVLDARGFSTEEKGIYSLFTLDVKAVFERFEKNKKTVIPRAKKINQFYAKLDAYLIGGITGRIAGKLILDDPDLGQVCGLLATFASEFTRNWPSEPIARGFDLAVRAYLEYRYSAKADLLKKDYLKQLREVGK